MKKKATCFFCYSWDNMDQYKLLSFIKDTIEEETNGDIVVILDKRNYRYNDDFDEKISKIREYDVIVPFFTPEFKSIVMNASREKQRELVKEYNEIQKRFEENPHSVFPVILTGNRDTAVPDCFYRKNCPNISEWKIKRTKEGKINLYNEDNILFEKFVTDLVGQTKYNFYNKSVEYKNALQALKELFWLTDTTELPPDCLVKMDIYSQIISQQYYFVAGRKGSGKSTFINNFKYIDREYFENNYKRMMPINAEDFNYDYVYNELIKKHIVDRDIIPPKDLLKIFWQVYFVLQCIFTIGIELEDGRIVDINRKRSFRNVVNKLKELLSLKYPSGKYKSLRGDGVSKQLFMLAAAAVDEQYNIAIDRANNKSIYASFLGNINAESILEYLFGIDLLEKFLNGLEKCTKKIIIALDGFDTNSEDFRNYTQKKVGKDSEEYNSRQEYETFLFRTLVEVVTQFKRGNFRDSIMATFQEYLDFCIVLPKDRYDQIIEDDRDSAKKRFCSLGWDALDLLELIVRRLEYLIIKIDETAKIVHTLDLFERFERALSFFPAIPKTVMINVEGYNRHFNLFNYLLRFSFWRPRDVISNFACILAYAITIDELDGGISVIKDEKVLDNEIVKLTIKNNARIIIQKELIDEYKNVFRNLDVVLENFMGSDLIIETEEFCNLLSKTRFSASYTYNLDKIDSKLYVLYQLGLIGLYYEESSARSLGYLHHICFSFNAGLQPILDFKKNEDFTNCRAKIIFNPILCERLSLKIDTTELICNWEKEYIIKLHRMKSILYAI